MKQGILNGFQVTIRGRFFWFNAYGIGVGTVDGWEWIRYR